MGEVALSVQFEPLQKFGLHHFGLLWQRLRERYPTVQNQPALDPVFETFEKRGVRQPTLQLEVLAGTPFPRAWFVSADGTGLVQVQRDRFIVNWRRVRSSDLYPRYSSLRARFVSELAAFEEFLRVQELGALVPTQCEVTYVNQIESGKSWTRHDEVAKVLNLWAADFQSDFLSEPETVSLTVRYAIHTKAETSKAAGRLYVDFKPAFRVSDSLPIFVMNLTARGAPQASDVISVLDFFDTAREHIVKGFTSLTCKTIHTEWGLRG